MARFSKVIPNLLIFLSSSCFFTVIKIFLFGSIHILFPGNILMPAPFSPFWLSLFWSYFYQCHVSEKLSVQLRLKAEAYSSRIVISYKGWGTLKQTIPIWVFSVLNIRAGSEKWKQTEILVATREIHGKTGLSVRVPAGHKRHIHIGYFEETLRNALHIRCVSYNCTVKFKELNKE